jgi:sensor c-di-GMP phosphodiesterase-like protein
MDSVAQLPSTAIGLIAFIVSGTAILIWRIYRTNISATNKHTDTFMTYIEKKNNNLERTTKEFAESMERITREHAETVRAMLAERRP